MSDLLQVNAVFSYIVKYSSKTSVRGCASKKHIKKKKKGVADFTLLSGIPHRIVLCNTLSQLYVNKSFPSSHKQVGQTLQKLMSL